MTNTGSLRARFSSWHQTRLFSSIHKTSRRRVAQDALAKTTKPLLRQPSHRLKVSKRARLRLPTMLQNWITMSKSNSSKTRQQVIIRILSLRRLRPCLAQESSAVAPAGMAWTQANWPCRSPSQCRPPLVCMAASLAWNPLPSRLWTTTRPFFSRSYTRSSNSSHPRQLLRLV